MSLEPLLSLPSDHRCASSSLGHFRACLQPGHSTSCFQRLGPFVGWTSSFWIEPSNHRSNSTSNWVLRQFNFPGLWNQYSRIMLSTWSSNLQSIDLLPHGLQTSNQKFRHKLGFMDRILINLHGYCWGEAKVFFCFQKKLMVKAFNCLFSSSVSSLAVV